jgi:hypothetical protein
MKDFYKDIRAELTSTTINAGDQEDKTIVEIKPDNETYQIVDWNKLNDEIDDYMKTDKKTKKKK